LQVFLSGFFSPFPTANGMTTRTRLPFDLLPIEDDGYHLLVDVRVNGRPAQLLVDTGASRTVFDKERILRFMPGTGFTPAGKTSTGLGTDSMEGQVGTLDTLELGALRLEKPVIVLLDLSHVNQSYSTIGLTPIDGVLGSDLLAAHDAVIDYRKKEITLAVRA
jgi:hypothetical protein